jgi:glycosyltransferase involved in cell wall biosynthesis
MTKRLVVFSHKLCWPHESSLSGYATDGGFPFQMSALSELFASTTLVVPCDAIGNRPGEIPLAGHNLTVVPLSNPAGRDLRRKLKIPFWLLRNLPILIREVMRADAVHTPIPGDICTIGMVLAFLMRKPLFVRHCGNWFVQKTSAEFFWKWFMERFAGNRNVCLATGGALEPPSQRNAAIRWIFSTSLREQELLHCGEGKREVPGDELRLIIACRQEKEKGTGIVIESLPLIAKRFPQVTLDVVGDGAALASSKTLAERLGVSSRVTFHGKVNHENVMRLLQRAHLFCYPTTSSEGFPKVVLESLACGTPVVTTRVSVLPQLIGSGCGFLMDEVTAPAVAQAVEEILLPDGRYSTMSDQAIKTARQYSLECWRDTIGEYLHSAWGPIHSNV